MSERFTAGPWKRRSIPGHLFELTGAAGEVVLRIRGGLVPRLEDAKLLEAAPELYEVLSRFTASADAAAGALDWPEYREARALLARIRGEG